ncbi:MAG TPA: PEP-CTERM sorting domain-containing protein [Verrucomicrobia bacterium]|nr:PEP-CTERM sorting domain-containing protein [Verrucomicrobiota bacterium]HOP98500.1 PEP-CTERM sorting domain-containing protein [Verrucomicrobiota bacterium]
MKTLHQARSLFRRTGLLAILTVGLASSSHGANVVVSGTDLAGNQPILDFLQANFADINLTFGDYSDPATIPAGTDVFIVGRILTSGAYDNAENSATFNSLDIPIVAFTSFVTRTAGNRWSWESGPTAGASVDGDEVIITAAGASIFGSEGAADWWTTATSGTGFNAAGTGTVGTGEILATIGGNILVAGWRAGDMSAGGVTFTANRLLFNLPDSNPNPPAVAVLPDTLAGQQALISALAAYTPLQVVPEPSSAALLGMGALAAIFRIRRRMS